MKWFKWTEGRQNSGYYKILLATLKRPLPFDLYLLKYPEGSGINWHKDEVPDGYRHFRLNIVLRKARFGGHFVANTKPLFKKGRVTLFRPDKNLHYVSRVKEGTRYVLSLGWLLKEKVGEDSDFVKESRKIRKERRDLLDSLAEK